MRRWLGLLGLLLLPALAHQATSFGEEGTSGNLGRVAVFTAVFLVVLLGTAVLGLRQARRRGGSEITWAVFPTVVVAVVGAMVWMALWNYRPVGGARVVVELTGQRYWWRVDYPEWGVVSAGEVWIPAGERVELRATSRDVFLSLSVPGLELRMDAIPGQTTREWVRAPRPGVYGGTEVEYVGPSTDKMRLRILALPPETFYAFIEEASSYPGPAGGAPELFLARCGGCHRVRGTAARGEKGPDLTLFANRTTFGSAVWPNREEFLSSWIRNAPGMKEGVAMPAFDDLGDEEVARLVSFLKTLGVEGYDFTPLGRVE